MVKWGRLFLSIMIALVWATVLLPLSTNNARAQLVEKVQIQSKTTDEFVRIVFRMGNVSQFDVSLKDETIDIDFGKKISTDFSTIITDLGSYVEKASLIDDGKKVRIKLKNRNFDLRKFRSSNFAGIDVIFSEEKEIANNNSNTAQTTISRPITRTRDTQRSGAIPILKSSVPSIREKKINLINPTKQVVYGPPLPPVNPTLFRTPKLKPELSLVLANTSFVGPPTETEHQKRLEAAFSFPPAPPKPGDDWEGEKATSWNDEALEQSLLELEINETKEEVAEAEEVVEEPIEEVVIEEEILEEEPEEIAEEDDQKYDMVATVKNINNEVRLIFPWEKNTAAAIYRRSGYTWAIFDRYKKIDLKKLTKSKYVKSAQQVFHKDYTIVKLDIRHSKHKLLNISAYKDDANWMTVIRHGLQQPTELSADIGIDSSSIISKAEIAIKEKGELLKIVDPVVGDRLVIVPLYRGKMGVSPARNFVDFSVINTIQGIVISLKSDKTFVTSTKENITISKRSGLNLYGTIKKATPSLLQLTNQERKPVQVRSILSFKTDQIRDNEPLYIIPEVIEEDESEESSEDISEDGSEDESDEDEEKAREEDEDSVASGADEAGDTRDYHETRRMMLQEIVEAETDEEKLAKRMELARYYFYNKLYAEALGVLKEIRKDDPENEDIEYRALLGASHLKMLHFVEAAEIFEAISENITVEEGKDEIDLLWWASNQQIRPRSMQSTKKIPLKFIENISNFINEYPKSFRQDLALLATDYYIENESLEDANSLIGLVLDSPNDDIRRNSARFYEAKVLEKEGFPDDAIKIWEDLAEEVFDRYNRARSTFAKYKLLYTLDRADKKETIEKLDNVRIVWKGDDFELELLKFLGGLYIFERDFVNGLRTWRELLTQFPKTQDALLIARQMKKIFTDLFDKGVAYEFDPFIALTLYFEFRELTPVGEAGDRIVRQLVDHFIEADLLENAAALLTHQVRFRSQGEERVRLAGKLADIHLTNKRPELTIQSLDFVADENIPDDLVEEFKYLRAKAMIQTGEYYDTLRLLVGDRTNEAQSLRLEVFLKQQNWFGIMNITEPRLAAVIDRGDPIKDQSMKDLLLLSIAYATQREHDKLLQLQNAFIDKIEDPNGRQVFAFVTNDRGAINHMDFEKTVQLEDIASFTTNYLFWPNRDWASVIQTLQPQIDEKQLAGKETLSQDEKNQVIQLAIAYVMQQEYAEDPKDTKQATRGLKRVQREFSTVSIDERSLPIFLSLTNDPDLIPDEALSTPTPIKNVESFVDSYESMFKKESFL